jgi:SulP family sulfate permease
MPELLGRRAWRRTEGYGWRGLAGDASGGAIAALVALPYGLAMAKLMGLPAELGLFTSILTAPITSLLGRNPVLIGGTASATVPFFVAVVQAQGVAGAAKLCLAAAVFMMIFALLRLGRYVTKVPQVVVSGFSCGVGAMMVVLQLRTLLGLPAAPETASASPLLQLIQVFADLGRARWQPMLLGLIVIAGAIVAARRWPRSPAALAGVAGFTWTPADVAGLLPHALGLAFVTSVNILITSRVVEHFQGRHRPLRAADADAELGAYGIANLCAGAFGAPISVGIPARSLANVRCGGTTRLSNFLHAAFLLSLVALGSGAIARIPLAALAGVTAYIGIGLLEWSTWRRLPRMRRLDAAAFLATATAVLTTNAVAAVVIGCAIHVARDLLDNLTRLEHGASIEPREADS